MGGFSPNRWCMTLLWLFFCPVLSFLAKMLSPVRLSSVCCLSVVCNVRAPYSGGSDFRQYFYDVRYLGYPCTDIHWKFHGDRPRGTPPTGELNTRSSQDIAISDLSTAIFRKRCKIGGKLLLITNRKSYMSFRLVAKSVTLNDLEQRSRVASGRTA